MYKYGWQMEVQPWEVFSKGPPRRVTKTQAQVAMLRIHLHRLLHKVMLWSCTITSPTSLLLPSQGNDYSSRLDNCLGPSKGTSECGFTTFRSLISASQVSSRWWWCNCFITNIRLIVWFFLIETTHSRFLGKYGQCLVGRKSCKEILSSPSSSPTFLAKRNGSFVEARSCRMGLMKFNVRVWAVQKMMQGKHSNSQNHS